jgi:hypothetical protein
MARIALAEMIEELRRELQEAVAAAEGQPIRFQLGEVTLEAQVEVSREKGGKAGLKFWVAEVGASGKAGHLATQKIVLTLLPVAAEGGAVKLSR